MAGDKDPLNLADTFARSIISADQFLGLLAQD